MMRIGITLGTRPEIIKLAPLIQELRDREDDYFVIHTNQHYDPELDARFFEELELDPADINLNIGSDSHARQTARMLEAIGQVIEDRRLTHMIVQGDTNSGLAGALAAAKLSCRVAHVEAGLRSYDPRMPEEVNRRVIDHLAHDLFPPTQTAREVLLGESVSGRIHEPFGNTAVDAVLRYSPQLEVPLAEREDRVLLTLHRPENVDDRETLRSILSGVGEVAEVHDLNVVFPAHPRTRKRMDEFGVSLPDRIAIVPPQSFSDVLGLQARCRLVMTDSGGLQEEACVVRTPCVVVRTHTDRPEALDVGSAFLAGVEEESIVAASYAMLNLQRIDWPQPFGDGSASKRIADGLASAEPLAAAEA